MGCADTRRTLPLHTCSTRNSGLAKTVLISPDLAEDIPAPWWTTPTPHWPTSRPARLPPPTTPAPAFPLAYNLYTRLFFRRAFPYLSTSTPPRFPRRQDALPRHRFYVVSRFSAVRYTASSFIYQTETIRRAPSLKRHVPLCCAMPLHFCARHSS